MGTAATAAPVLHTFTENNKLTYSPLSEIEGEWSGNYMALDIDGGTISFGSGTFDSNMQSEDLPAGVEFGLVWKLWDDQAKPVGFTAAASAKFNPFPYSAGTLINPDFLNEGWLWIEYPDTYRQHYQDFVGDFYYGFSFQRGDGTLYGWLNLSYRGILDADWEDFESWEFFDHFTPTEIVINSWVYDDEGYTILAGSIPEPATSAAMTGAAALLAGAATVYRRRKTQAERPAA